MKLRRIALAIAGCLGASQAFGQVFDPAELGIGVSNAVSSVPVELLPPGARALGLAGAFTAVADDATAAEANPAGLTILRDPEFSLHFRSSDNNIRFYDAEARNPEQFPGGPPGQLVKTFSDSSDNVSFASFVYPWERWVFSAFYTNNLDLGASVAPETLFNSTFVDTFISENSLDGELDGFGLSLAFRVNDKLSLGLTVKRQDLDVRALDRHTIRNFRDFEFIFEDNTAIGDANDYAGVLLDEFVITNLIDGDDSDTVINAGLLFRPTDKWSIGLTYKEGGSYDIVANNSFQQSLGCQGSGEFFNICEIGFTGIDLTPFNGTEPFNTVARIDVPDTITLGFAYRPSDTLLFSFDIANVGYDDLPQPRATTLGFNFPVNGVPFGNPAVTLNDVEPISDETSLHFGIEKVFFPNSDWFNAFTLRGGAFTDNDHDGTRLVDSDDTHITVGIGGVFAERFQVDLAGEFSDRVDNIVLSAIYRFQ